MPIVLFSILYIFHTKMVIFFFKNVLIVVILVPLRLILAVDDILIFLSKDNFNSKYITNLIYNNFSLKQKNYNYC